MAEAARIYGFVFDGFFGYLTVSIFLIYLWWSYNKAVAFVTMIAAITLNISKYYLKLFFAIPRPCVGKNFCPETYDFPSGHSLGGIWLGLCIIKYGRNKYWAWPLGFFFLLQPFSRVLGEVHSREAAFCGACLGLIFFMFTDKKYLPTIIKTKLLNERRIP